MWIYYETDGDAGAYNIKLFSTQDLAQQYKDKKHDAYGKIDEIRADTEVVKVPIEETKCPECDGPMVSRKGKYGIFWGCKRYPDCRGTRDSMGRSKAERDAERNSEVEINPDKPASERQAENDKFRFRRE